MNELLDIVDDADDRVTLATCLAVVALWALAVFVRDKLEAMARRAWHRIACACMQCDEAAP